MGDGLNIAGYAKDLASIAESSAAARRGSVDLLTKAAKSPADVAAGVQAAKDFESVLLQQMMQSMRGTVGESGLLDEDEGSGQIQDMFWSFLSQDVANKGGLGLWKDIYRQTIGGEPPSDAPAHLELLK